MDLNRREFVGGAAAAALTVCGCLGGCAGSGSAGSASAGGGSGTQNPEKAEAMQTGTVDIGTAASYPNDGAYGALIASDRLIVVRKAGTISAVSAICPHRAANCQPLRGNTIVCAKHGSRFDLDGKVTKGPAESDLPHYAISHGAGGRLIVDKAKKLGPTDPGASVAV